MDDQMALTSARSFCWALGGSHDSACNQQRLGWDRGCNKLGSDAGTSGWLS
jgi:hypothetical protein